MNTYCWVHGTYTLRTFDHIKVGKEREYIARIRFMIKGSGFNRWGEALLCEDGSQWHCTSRNWNIWPNKEPKDVPCLLSVGWIHHFPPGFYLGMCDCLLQITLFQAVLLFCSRQFCLEDSHGGRTSKNPRPSPSSQVHSWSQRLQWKL